MRSAVLAATFLISTSLLFAQHLGKTGYTKGRGLIGMAQLGPHENGGRACMSCHMPHTGASEDVASEERFVLRDNFVGPVTYGGTWSNAPLVRGITGDNEMWGTSVGPVHVRSPFTTEAMGFASNDIDIVDLSRIQSGSYGRMNRGVMLCLTCHDGQVARGGMMTNESFERVAGLLPRDYGAGVIPTLLGADAGRHGNYKDDHPIGPDARLSALGIGRYVTLDSFTDPTRLVASGFFPGSDYQRFQSNYGLPLVLGARAGFGWAVDAQSGSGTYDAERAYVVCTTCHTPHSMFRTSASPENPIARFTSGTFPTWSFLAAPYNPGAAADYARYASSSTQFCRQCHFDGAGGANEAVGMYNIRTAF